MSTEGYDMQKIAGISFLVLCVSFQTLSANLVKDWTQLGISAAFLASGLVCAGCSYMLAKQMIDENREYNKEWKTLEHMNLKIRDELKYFGNHSEHTIRMEIPYDFSSEKTSEAMDHWRKLSFLHSGKGLLLYPLSWSLAGAVVLTPVGYGILRRSLNF